MTQATTRSAADQRQSSPSATVAEHPPRTDSAPRGRPRASGRPGTTLAIVLAGQFMAVLDASVVNVAAPAIHAGLHASGAGLQFIVAGYTIAYAVLLVTGARIGDLLGHRNVFLAGLAVFTLASLGCGLAGSTAELVGLRFVQGAGAAAMIPQVLSLIQRTFTGASRARAMSAYSAVLAGGVVVGQVAGGLLISADILGATWRPVFGVNVPIGLALLVAGWRTLPRGTAQAGRGLDLPGLVTLAAAVLAVVVPLLLGQPEHWPSWGKICLFGGIAMFAIFAMAERRQAARGGSPLVPGRVLRLDGVRSGIGALFTIMTVFGGMFFTLALHLQGGLGETPLRAGLTFAPAAAAFAVVSLSWQRLPAKFGPWLPIAGFAGTATGLALLAVALRSGTNGGVVIYLALGLIGMSMASAFGPLMTGILMRVPVTEAADATGVIVTVNQLALVVGVASLGALYLNLAGTLPAGATVAFRVVSARSEGLTCAVLAALAVGGGTLAAWRAWPLRPRRTAAAVVTRSQPVPASQVGRPE